MIYPLLSRPRTERLGGRRGRRRRRQGGATYVAFAPAAEGEQRDYFVEAPGATTGEGRHTSGSVEFSPDGDVRYALDGTTEAQYVVGTGAPALPDGFRHPAAPAPAVTPEQ